MRKKLIWLALLGAMMTMFVSPPVAQAVGTGDPIITAPTDGGTVRNGFIGPITVDFSNAPADTYYADLSCDYTDRSHTFRYDVTGDDIQTWTMNTSLMTAQGCYLSIDNYYDSSTSSVFTVAAPPLPSLVVDNASAYPGTFYPLVHDGYRDSTTISFRLNRAANVTAKVINSTGHVVRRAPLGTTSSGQRRWTWNGRNNYATKVPTGAYRIQVVAVANRTRSVTRTVKVATAERRKTVTKYRDGYDTSSTSRSGDCFVDYSYYYSTVDLDCWGGSYAQANFHFAIPANAYNLGWSARGYTAFDDWGSGWGSISKWGTRTSSRDYRVSVQVTDWRAYSVTRVLLTYSYKYQI